MKRIVIAVVIGAAFAVAVVAILQWVASLWTWTA
jgi:hypothetical protein